MKLIKKYIKLILVLIFCMILVSSISIYATYSYFATDISYTINGNEISVSEALNDLYKNKKETTEELQNRIKELEDELNTLSNNSFSSIRYLKSTDTLISNGGTAANANIELNAGTYILIASGKNSEYSVMFSLTGDDSIEEIGSATYSGSGAENINGYHNGRGVGRLIVYTVTLTKTTTLTFSVSGKSANGTAYNGVGCLSVYEFHN